MAADKMSCTIAGTPSAATASKVYTITVANGAQTGMATVTIGTTDPTDVTDPTLSTVTATAATDTTVTVNLTSNEGGTGYVVVSNTNPTLTAQQVINTVNTNPSAGFAGSTTLTANVAATVSIKGLLANTQYFVYAVAVDAGDNRSTVGTTSFTTTVATDTTAPLLSATTVTATSDTTATVSLTSNEAGTGYILITARDAANTLDNAAIIARVIAAASSDVVATAAITIPGTATTTNITGLTASTTYTAYIVATDNAATPNNSTVATVDFATEATPDVTDPVISAVEVTNTFATSAQLRINNDEDGMINIIVLPDAADKPTPSEVKSPGLGTISISPNRINTDRMRLIDVSPLQSNTEYKAYVVITDASGNESEIVASPKFATSNVAPVANAGSVSTVLVGGPPATLDGTGSTDDGAITTYAWVQTTTPTGVTGTLTRADTDTAIFTPTAGTAAGDVVFTLTVTDNGNVGDNASPL
ncbi:MAG: hypothetical protein K8963_07280, partial [Proteobacteria bacterium]|nr:hypothetical protein [Pseudomonadota bacterium]